MHRLILFYLLVWLFGAGAIVSRAEAQFSDTEFDPFNWTFVEIDTNEGGSVNSQVVSDGNPGNALRVSLTLEPSSGFSQIIGVWLWNQIYEPATNGGFGSIDYSEDARLIEGTGDGHATGVAIQQNDSIYIARVAFTPEMVWTQKGRSGMVPSDFSRVSGSTPGPNFSDGAPPMEFGFYRANSHPASGGSGGTRIADIDNWQVVLVQSDVSVEVKSGRIYDKKRSSKPKDKFGLLLTNCTGLAEAVADLDMSSVRITLGPDGQPPFFEETIPGNLFVPNNDGTKFTYKAKSPVQHKDQLLLAEEQIKIKIYKAELEIPDPTQVNPIRAEVRVGGHVYRSIATWSIKDSKKITKYSLKQ